MNRKKKESAKQAVAKKMIPEFNTFLLSLIEDVLKKTLITNSNLKIKLRFNRLIVQDSTIVKLPLCLFEEFSGVSNGKVPVANARIQVVYDLISEQFLKFEIYLFSTPHNK